MAQAKEITYIVILATSNFVFPNHAYPDLMVRRLIASSFILPFTEAANTLSTCIETNIKNLVHEVDQELIESHCKKVIKSIETYPWSREVPEAVLVNDAFPFTVLTEPPFINITKRNHFSAYMDFIAQTSDCVDVACISLAANARAYDIREPPIIFEAAESNSLNSYGVEETWDRGKGSCTSMSVFLITALRMIGVPARLVGVPHWNLGKEKCPLGDSSPDCGNHNWVEVFVPGNGWSFIDQRRPDLQVLPLNQSWFYPEWTNHMHAGDLNHSIYAVSFLDPSDLGKDYPKGTGVEAADHFPMVWDWNYHNIPGWDVTKAYTKSAKLIDETWVIKSD